MWKRSKAIFKFLIRRNQTLDRAFRLHYLRGFKARRQGYPDWKEILAQTNGQWADSLDSARKGKKVLLATSVGGYLAGTTLESAIGVALTLRGAEVHVLLCDEALPACFECQVSWYPDQTEFIRSGPSRDLCKSCYEPGRKLFDSLGLIVHRYGEFLTTEDRREAEKLAAALSPDEIEHYSIDGISIGQHALAGTLRFYARATLEGEVSGAAVLRRYFVAALLSVRATERLLQKYSFDSAVFSHGIYVPFGLVGEVARKLGVKVINWNPAYRKQRFVFSHDGTYHHTLMSEPVSEWKERIDFIVRKLGLCSGAGISGQQTHQHIRPFC